MVLWEIADRIGNRRSGRRSVTPTAEQFCADSANAFKGATVSFAHGLEAMTAGPAILRGISRPQRTRERGRKGEATRREEFLELFTEF